ncbi:YggS family pyridoxal phosphate-dependent enzyme [Coxiella endosymbiont of Amblyomma nuttalli]|uniref:YggS family pyridoxal phosphate-dependent enzyme n=1 Tax=Coxiella endosymbiont of Amblyomma nuttalli TaxID=2749996 RepID=UPI001BAE42C7|nr:YggS family pyridoxal phosphate-dependent enzyme [Coxiella endosymbiont of Amblyomma nuttalli]QTS84250.1 hypothetical protein CEAn_00761 [Coxiella endosymbiont of Amblyomma nuttalli]
MSISCNIKKINEEIWKAENLFGRTPSSVILLAVSKSQGVEKIKIAVTCGQKRFGENYLQEALPKINLLRAYDLEWHFIGAIQANKARLISTHFSWVHSISSLKIAEQLQRHRASVLSPLNICIQINISGEKNKSGVSLSDLPEFVSVIKKFNRLRLRGLMAIPANYKNFETQKRVFKKLQRAQKQLIEQGLPLDVLSMGMTHDFPAAIAAGSTMIRIGTGIFGSRSRDLRSVNNLRESVIS